MGEEYESGQVLCEEEEVRMRWEDYFVTLLESDEKNDPHVSECREGPIV